MKSIIYDVDGTLWNASENVAESWRIVCRSRGIPGDFITSERLGREFGKLLPDIADSMFPELPPSERYDLIEACCAHENRYVQEMRQPLYDGVEETIKAIHALGLPQVILSNSQSGYVEALVNTHGLDPYLTGYFQAGDTGLPKSENIKIACERWHLEDPVYVGDTMGDYNAARAAGVPFVHAAYGFGEVADPDYVIDCPLDLVRLVQGEK